MASTKNRPAPKVKAKTDTDDGELVKFASKVGTKSRGQTIPATGIAMNDEPANPTNVMIIAGQKSWASDGSKYWPCQAVYEKLPAGLYEPKFSNTIGFYVEETKIDTDDLLILPDTASDQVIEEFERFWLLREEFVKRGFLHKRGILLHGEPGCGKTSTIQLLIKKIVNDGGLAIYATRPDATSSALQIIRNIEPDRPIIVIMEDLDALIDNFGESGYLSLLDGENQVNNVVYVATTNYPERLDKRFVDRPSRFDTIKFIDMPSADARELYLKTKEPSLTKDELTLWVKETKDFSIAHLKEIIISVKCYQKPFDKVINRLKVMKEKKFKRTTLNGFGFTGGDQSEEELTG